MRITLVIATILPMLAATTLVADAKPKGKKPRSGAPAKRGGSAKAHMSNAAKAHKAGKFELALTELQAAYAIDPQSKLLFAMAQVQQKLDRCDDAIANYEKFLATTKDKQQKAVVKQAIGACTKKIAAAPTTEPAPPASEPTVFRDNKPDEPPPPAPASDPAPEPALPATEIDDSPFASGVRVAATAKTTRGPSPWYTDILGDALVVSGVASGALSIVMYSKARGDLDAAEKSSTLADYDVLVSQARDHRMYAVVFAGAGGVLLSAGLLRYALRDSGEKRAVAIAPTSGGGLVTWSGGF